MKTVSHAVVAGGLITTVVLTGCSSAPRLDSAAVPFVESAAIKYAEANDQALRETGRLSTNGVLAAMDTAPTKLYTRMEEDLYTQGCADSVMCLMAWFPVDNDQAIATGFYGDEPDGQFMTSVDATTGEGKWTTERIEPGSTPIEICSQATPSALVCMATGVDESTANTLRTLSLRDGEQIAKTSFGSGSRGPLLQMDDLSRRGDSVYMAAVRYEHDEPNGTWTLHSAKVDADGSIEWISETPIAEPDITGEQSLLNDTHVLGDQVIVTHVTTPTPDGEPLALNEGTGEAVPITSENAETLTKILDSAQPAVDDGSAADLWFRVDEDTGTLEVRAVGSDAKTSPVWSSEWELTAVCGGHVALLSDPFDQGSRTMRVVSATDGTRQWNTWLSEDDAISCDGTRIIVADGVQLRGLDAETGAQAWAIPAPWDSVTRILPLNPFGPSKRFAVLGGQDDPDEFADIYTYTVFEAP